MNLQAVLTVLVTGRVSHVRVVASEMPDKVTHPSQGDSEFKNLGGIPSWETAILEIFCPSQGGKASC